MRTRWLTATTWVMILGTARAVAAPQALEIGPANTNDLPGGREADGIIGDFVLRNDRIEAVIGGNQHQRKPNMVVYYDAPTAGCLFDLTLRGTHNDQITCFGPGQQRGQMSNVRIVKAGRDGEAVVRAELSAAAGGGVSRRHDYRLRDGRAYLEIVSSYRNGSAKRVKIKPEPAVVGLFNPVQAEGISAADGPDPACRQGYAWASMPPSEGLSSPEPEVTLAPGEEKRFGWILAVGTSPAAAFGEILAARGRTAPLQIRLQESDGTPVADATVLLKREKAAIPAYPDRQGRLTLLVPPGRHALQARDIGRPDVEKDVDVGEDGAACEIVMAPASRIAFDVRGEDGQGIPCKVQFIGRDGTKDPDLGPKIRAHGCDNQYHSENGQFTQQVPPGHYTVVMTRGIEYDHVERDIDVAPGERAEVKAVLRRIVDTRGWISTDFHNHTTVSGDNYCGTLDRVINLAAENVEFAPTTEHNRLFDWTPYIEQLGLASHLTTLSGLELTGHGPHLNAFPLTVVPYTQNNGAPLWHPDPRVSALTLRAMPDADERRWVQVNHPQMAEFFNDRNRDGRADGGYEGLERMIDGLELMAHDLLSGKPMTTHLKTDKPWENWGFLWLQMLNAGRIVRPVVVSDAHEVALGGVGGWRMYVPSSTDEPARIDSREILINAKAGKRLVTTGPFLEVRTNTGGTFGETITNTKTVRLTIRIQCNTWTGVNRVAVLVNGRPPADLDFTAAKQPALFREGVVRFEQDVEVPLDRDAHLIVAAVGEGLTLAKAYGHGWQKDLPPIAFGSPIFVDVDGNGFQPNGDMLGHDFLNVKPQ